MDLRDTFNEDAERYDRSRPGYPAALFDDLAATTGLREGARVLEIGPGTGQATVELLRRGYHVTAVERGPNMAAVLQRNIAAFPVAKVFVSGFESWPLPDEPFELVFSATAFHWIDPVVRIVKAASALRPGGALAVVGTGHVAGGDEEFFARAQECYERHMPGTPPGGEMLPQPETVPDDRWGVPESGLFEAPKFRRHVSELEYTTAEYLDVIGTYSNHIALEASARASLYSCIADLIDTDFSGHIRKAYQRRMMITRRR